MKPRLQSMIRPQPPGLPAYPHPCKLDLEDEIPHHSTFSANQPGRFRERDVLRHIFERVVWAAMAKASFDATVLEANASRYHS